MAGCCSCCCIRKPETDPEESDHQVRRNVIRLLMIGNQDVGKSTIIQQMQNLALIDDKTYTMYDDDWNQILEPFTENCRRSKSLLVHQNVARIIGILITKVQDFGYQFQNPENAKAAEQFLEAVGDVGTIHQRGVTLTPELGTLTGCLWADTGVQRAFERRCEFQISDSAKYFMESEKLADICSPDYVPSAQDLLRSRDPTRDVKDYNFRIEGEYFTFRDLGGQPIEQERLPGRIFSWLKDSDNGGRNFIIYVASLADYNQISAKHPNRTVLDENIMLLNILMKIPQLRSTSFMVFLNKTDVFHEKLRLFRDFLNPAWDFQQYMSSEFVRNPNLNPEDERYKKEAEKCVARKFNDALKGTFRTNKTLFFKFTCATDSTNMKAIIGTVKMEILTAIMKQKIL